MNDNVNLIVFFLSDPASSANLIVFMLCFRTSCIFVQFTYWVELILYLYALVIKYFIPLYILILTLYYMSLISLIIADGKENKKETGEWKNLSNKIDKCDIEDDVDIGGMIDGYKPC